MGFFFKLILEFSSNFFQAYFRSSSLDSSRISFTSSFHDFFWDLSVNINKDVIRNFHRSTVPDCFRKSFQNSFQDSFRIFPGFLHDSFRNTFRIPTDILPGVPSWISSIMLSSLPEHHYYFSTHDNRNPYRNCHYIATEFSSRSSYQSSFQNVFWSFG